ncbi:hypothetical protein KMP13_18710 [Epibacterium ulvae]|uniref:hypothetical protein n=1 Tax=Epibacterium ulvae TaxID=1156985 RepID=UPI001BFCC482|nr:hypothetical protein [Epibacterium ulvae]MBT8155856.1 hypothetical protein [Epibacterium ulvae]
MNTQDWRRPDRQSGGPYGNDNTPSPMWNEMIAMRTALEALGPDHQVVGAMWSLGQYDGFGTLAGPEGYDAACTLEYPAFTPIHLLQLLVSITTN